MMKKAFLFLCVAAFSLRTWGSDHASSGSATPFVESTWPGIEMHVAEVKRIPGNRLLVVVALRASAKAPPFTLIGTPPPPPPIDAREKVRVDSPPTPFSLQGASMIEDQTQQKYDMVPPSPKPPFYRASMILASLSHGQTLYMTIQFLAPPPPPPDENGVVPKQTVSILLPKTKGPITKVVIPPPASLSPAT